MGIQETKDVLDFINGLTTDLATAKADGSITTREYIRVAISNGPPAVRAFVGMDQIVSEIKDLDKEELQSLIDELMNIWLNVSKIFLKE